MSEEVSLSLGSALLGKRQKAINSFLQLHNATTLDLMPLSQTDNPFLICSLVEICCRAKRFRDLPRLLGSWLTFEQPKHDPIIDPSMNDIIYKSLSQGYPNHKTRYVVRTLDSLGSEMEWKDLIFGIGDFGLEIAEQRKCIMSNWAQGIHYIWSNQSFSPLLYVRAVIELSRKWCDRAGEIRVGLWDVDRHKMIPELRADELEKAKPFAWENERFLFGYFLPVVPSSQAHDWLIQTFANILEHLMSKGTGNLPKFPTILNLQDTLCYKPLPDSHQCRTLELLASILR